MFHDPNQTAGVAELLGQLELPSGLDVVHSVPPNVAGVDVSITVDVLPIGRPVVESPAIC